MIRDSIRLAMFLALAGCAHDYDLMKMEEQVGGYASAIRWNLFKQAAGYLDPPPTSAPDWKWLEGLQVTSYAPQFREVLPSGQVMTQTIEIRYLPPGGVVEKRLLDNQRWRYDVSRERWVLETGLPRFQ